MVLGGHGDDMVPVLSMHDHQRRAGVAVHREGQARRHRRSHAQGRRRDRQPDGHERVLRARRRAPSRWRGVPARSEAPAPGRGVPRRRVRLQGPLPRRAVRHRRQGRREDRRAPAHRRREGDAEEERGERAGASSTSARRAESPSTGDSPSVEVESPSLEVESSSFEVESPSLEVESSSFEVESPSLEVESTSFEVESSSVGGGTGKKGARSPHRTRRPSGGRARRARWHSGCSSVPRTQPREELPAMISESYARPRIGGLRFQVLRSARALANPMSSRVRARRTMGAR